LTATNTFTYWWIIAQPEDIVMGLRDAHTRSAWLARPYRLSTREQAVIRDRHLSAHTKTLEELGITLGISKERVRQIEARAMENCVPFDPAQGRSDDDVRYIAGGVKKCRPGAGRTSRRWGSGIRRNTLTK
jgi:hypothetical protein